VNIKLLPGYGLDIGTRGKAKRAAFTLVELLVVIGIIAVLIAILLPVLSKARQAANQTKCMSNIRQIVQAFVMYENDNYGFFPNGAIKTATHDEDWIWWQPDISPTQPRISEIGEHGVGKYLDISQNNLKVMQCPGDQLDFRPNSPSGGAYPPYPCSYTMNNFFHSVVPANAAGFDDKQGVEKITAVVQPSSKILIIEEDEHTIDDGYATIYPYPSNSSGVFASTPFTNLLAIRHDISRQIQADTITAALPVPNLQCRGNAGFCDGHAEYLPRSTVHCKYHQLPDVVGFPWFNAPDFTGETE
jgi:prepilin-type N-terminal cleavage/methylation domain-containing protein/prepilin-type processing-associated H-X9-DG protein